jgi:hypothetical protein
VAIFPSSDPDKVLARGQAVMLSIIAVPFAAIGFLLALLLELPKSARLPMALGSGVLGYAVVHFGSQWIAGFTARGISRFLAPRGDSTPYAPTFSYQDSLAVSGDLAGALRSYERHLARNPTDVEAQVRTAELALKAGDATRAASLFSGVRRVPNLTVDRELYATQRLIDVYLDSLGDRGKALVELRRLVERFPATREAQHARVAIERIKRGD